MAAGAHFSAKKGARLWAWMSWVRVSGVVSWMVAGPRREVEQTHMSRRPKAARASSIRRRVASSDVMSNG
jgi:hypothetical protein